MNNLKIGDKFQLLDLVITFLGTKTFKNYHSEGGVWNRYRIRLDDVIKYQCESNGVVYFQSEKSMMETIAVATKIN